MSERERIGFCEVCDKPIYDGDRYYSTADGCELCPECSPMLSDVIQQHEEVLAADEWRPWDLPYETREEMLAELDRMKADLAENGDRNLCP